MKIIFIGFMGAGKSSVSKLLAERTGETHYEIDDLILQRVAPLSIRDVFETKGEKYFREIEQEVLREVLESSSGIVSTGGGVIESDENRALLNSEDSTIVYLDTSFDTVRERIGDPSTRPLFSDLKAARERYDSRSSLYREIASLIISTEKRTPSEIVEIVRNFMSEPTTVSPYVNSVIGDPIAHSLSPKMHNTGYLGVELHSDCTFLASRVSKENLSEFIEQWKNSERCNGLAVTIPLKEEIIPLLDSLSDDVKALGAVNTVLKEDGERLFGENTDWIGIYNPLKERTSLVNKRCCVIGAGGTARAACYALKKESKDITLINRSREKGELLAKEFDAQYIPLDEINSLTDYDIVIHTTSVGLNDDERSLFPKEAFNDKMIVMDVVYTPRMTKLLKNASQAGAEIICGDEMFLAQGMAQFKLFTGKDAPEALMREAISDEN